MRYHLFQKFFEKVVKIKETSFLLTLIHMAMTSDKPSLHSFCSHFQENKATTIEI